MPAERAARCRDAGLVLASIGEHVHLLKAFPERMLSPDAMLALTATMLKSHVARLEELCDEMRRSIAARRTTAPGGTE